MTDGDSSSIWISTNEALLEYIWTAILDAAGVPDNERHDLLAMVTFDPRSHGVIPSRTTLGSTANATIAAVDMDRSSRYDAAAQENADWRDAHSDDDTVVLAD